MNSYFQSLFHLRSDEGFRAGRSSRGFATSGLSRSACLDAALGQPPRSNRHGRGGEGGAARQLRLRNTSTLVRHG